MCFITAATIDYHKIIFFDCWLDGVPDQANSLKSIQAEGSILKRLTDELPVEDTSSNGLLPDEYPSVQSYSLKSKLTGVHQRHEFLSTTI
ncbi:hypothetical protein Tco_0476278 [Tanacetum coccineum]